MIFIIFIILYSVHLDIERNSFGSGRYMPPPLRDRQTLMRNKHPKKRNQKKKKRNLPSHKGKKINKINLGTVETV